MPHLQNVLDDTRFLGPTKQMFKSDQNGVVRLT